MAMSVKLRMCVLTDNEFAPGEIVTIKSEGPPMTVLGFCEDCGEVEVAWFNFDEEFGAVFFAESFPASALKLYDGDI